MFHWKRNRIVLEGIERYIGVVSDTLHECQSCLAHYRLNGRDEGFRALVEVVGEKEHSADELRRHVELELYRKSLLPESREDVLLLMERTDLIPNQAEDVVRMIENQHLDLPPEVCESVIALVDLAQAAAQSLASAALKALTTQDDIQGLVTDVLEKEGAGDEIERHAISRLFSTDIPVGEKILCRDAVSEAGQLLDLEEDVAYFLLVFVVKRHV